MVKIEIWATQKAYFLVKRNVGKEKSILFCFQSCRRGKKVNFFVPKVFEQPVEDTFLLPELSLK
jgi:hypothetical protein